MVVYFIITNCADGQYAKKPQWQIINGRTENVLVLKRAGKKLLKTLYKMLD
jgi:hypothetical protein